ncbi:FAD-dependent monooxygenase [Pseudonocardia sp. CA-107938]|uniref:FAD-dependent monooxygenase n=1 Tax=Pseudonocardia sp. CA-107938 TaxID=3240021 RepID=UPI003D8D8418
MPRRPSTVLIVGAGIAGPALALWLQRYGFRPTVVERAPQLRRGGHAVDLRGVSRAVAARMGVLEAVRAARLVTVDVTLVDGDGAPIETMRADDFGGDGQLSDLEILRSDLAGILHDATAGVGYRFGEQVVAIEPGADGVDVTFGSGARERHDLVVGADGQHSQVRRLVFGESPDAVRPMGVHAAWWRTANHLGLQDRALEHADGDRMVGIRPVDGNRSAAAFLGFPSDGLPPGPYEPEEALRIVRERSAGMGWEVPRLVAAIDDTSDLFLEEFSQVVLDTWARGRVVLLGDAAFCPSPLSGQGTALALVGAYVLAGALATEPDPAAAFATYERTLRPWVERTQALACDGADGPSIAALANDFTLPEPVAAPAMTRAIGETATGRVGDRGCSRS